MESAVTTQAGQWMLTTRCLGSIVLCLLAWSALISEGSPSKRACTLSNAKQTQLSLICPEGHVIHVESTLTSRGHRGNISDCVFLSECVVMKSTGDSLLLPMCNGLQSCTETVTRGSNSTCTEGSLPAYFQVQYSCIAKIQITNVCSDVYVTSLPDGDAVLYFASPAFLFGSTPQGRQCSCRLHGNGGKATVLDLHFIDSGGSLLLSNKNATILSIAGNQIFINSEISGSNVDNLVFSDKGLRNQKAWIQVTASTSQLSAACGNPTTTTTTTASTTTTNFTTTPAFSTNTARTTTNNTITTTTSTAITTNTTTNATTNNTTNTAAATTTNNTAIINNTTTNTTTTAATITAAKTATATHKAPNSTVFQTTSSVSNGSGGTTETVSVPPGASAPAKGATTSSVLNSTSTGTTTVSSTRNADASANATQGEVVNGSATQATGSSVAVGVQIRSATTASLDDRNATAGSLANNSSASADQNVKISMSCDCGALVAVSLLCVVLGVILVVSVVHQIWISRRLTAQRLKASKASRTLPPDDVDSSRGV